MQERRNRKLSSNDKSFIDVFEDYKLYAEKRHKKQGYITTIQDFNNHILPYFQNRTIQSLTKIDIINWQNKILYSMKC